MKYKIKWSVIYSFYHHGHDKDVPITWNYWRWVLIKREILSFVPFVGMTFESEKLNFEGRVDLVTYDYDSKEFVVEFEPLEAFGDESYRENQTWYVDSREEAKEEVEEQVMVFKWRMESFPSGMYKIKPKRREI